MAELLSIRQVAQITGLHEMTIRRYVRLGRLEAVRIGRRIRVQREAVDRLLKTVTPEAAPEPEATDTAYLKESATTYKIAAPGQRPMTTPSLIGKVATGLAQLSVEDIHMVARIVVRLQEPHQNVSPRLSPAEVVAEARQQAALLSDVPRAEIAARFGALSEEIRQQAIARGVAIEGDWLRD